MKTSVLIRCIVLFISLGFCRAHAALEWNEREISVQVRRDAQKEVSAKFNFKNTGKKAVAILGVSTSCGCTVANPESSTVASGEKSNVQALFTIGDRHGEQLKKITVTTDDPETPVTVLTFKITILEPGSTVPAAH
jgi:uncharacterized protein DUF1573